MSAAAIGIAFAVVTISLGCVVAALAGLVAYSRARDEQWRERRR